MKTTTKRHKTTSALPRLTEIEIPTAEAWLASGAITETIRGEENTYYIDGFYREFFCKNYPEQIEIKTDSHKPQQHATICRWDGNQWQRVASLLPDAMQSDSGLAYKPNRPSPCDFDKDRARLLQVAAGILG